MRCEDEQLGALLMAADLSGHIIGQSSSHADDIANIVWREFIAPSVQARRPVEKAIP